MNINKMIAVSYMITVPVLYDLALNDEEELLYLDLAEYERLERAVSNFSESLEPLYKMLLREERWFLEKGIKNVY